MQPMHRNKYKKFSTTDGNEEQDRNTWIERIFSRFGLISTGVFYSSRVLGPLIVVMCGHFDLLFVFCAAIVLGFKRCYSSYIRAPLW